MRLGSSGKPGCIAAVRPGSSTNTTSGAIGAVSWAAATSDAGPGPDRGAGHREGPAGGHADRVERDAEGDADR